MIEPERYYNLSEIIQLDLIPWFNRIMTLSRYVKLDYQTDNYLKAIKFGTGKGRRWQIKGENIINYIAEIESRQNITKEVVKMNPGKE